MRVEWTRLGTCLGYYTRKRFGSEMAWAIRPEGDIVGGGYFFYTKLNKESITRRSCLSFCDLGSTAKTLDKFYEIESCSLGSLIKQSISECWFLFWNALFWSPLSSLEVGLCLLNYFTLCIFYDNSIYFRPIKQIPLYTPVATPVTTAVPSSR